MVSARIPLIVGIAGHREIHADDAERLTGQIRSELEKLRKDYPHTPIILLSSLGPGADRLAAEVALDGIADVKLAAVLPWPEGVCDQHLHRDGDRSKFDKLLKSDSRKIYLPLPVGMKENAVCQSEEDRQTCYAEVSRYITHHSQIMMAVWNGKERTDSQTWQVIQWHMEGTPAPFAAAIGYLDEPETGPLIHLPARRVGDPEACHAELG